MNDRPIGILVLSLGLAGFLYTFLNPSAVKAANDSRKFGFGQKPIWFWRTVGALGSMIAAIILLQITLGR